MRKVINSTYISLDGVVERPQEWPSSGDDGGEGDAIQTELLFGCDAVLMGRRSYLFRHCPPGQLRAGRRQDPEERHRDPDLRRLTPHMSETFKTSWPRLPMITGR
jgi:hypothetical protein